MYKNETTIKINEENITDATYEEITCVIKDLYKQGWDITYGSKTWKFADDFERSDFEAALTECMERIRS